jgi:hypothetical protein
MSALSWLLNVAISNDHIELVASLEIEKSKIHVCLGLPEFSQQLNRIMRNH